MMKVSFLHCFALLLSAAGVASSQWQRLPGAGLRDVRALYISDTFMIAAGFTGIFRSSDHGTSWQVRTDTIGSRNGRAISARGDTLYYGATVEHVHRSIDAGVTWTRMRDSLSQNYSVLCFLADQSRLLAGGFSAVTTLQDTSWRIYAPTFYNVVYALASDGGHMYAGTDNSGVWLSDDSGVTWRQPPSPMPQKRVRGVFAESSTVLAGYESDVVYRSTDAGTTWAPVVLDSFFVCGLCFTRAGKLIIAGTTRGVYTSLDDGATWKWANEGIPIPPGISVQSIFIHHDTVYIGTSQWIWSRPLSELLPPSGVDEPATGNRTTTLGQSIPNPASSEVVIPYSLAAAGHTTLKVYNPLLQEQATLIDGNEEQGWHEARLNAAALPSGTYYYRLISGSTVQTRQMVIVR